MTSIMCQAHKTLLLTLSAVSLFASVGHRLVTEPLHELAREAAVVSDTAVQQTFGARTRTTALVSHLPQLIPDSSSLPFFSVEDLRDAQSKHKSLSLIHFYVERSRRPSRREMAQEAQEVAETLGKVCSE